MKYKQIGLLNLPEALKYVQVGKFKKVGGRITTTKEIPCQFKDSFTGKPLSKSCPLCSSKEGE